MSGGPSRLGPPDIFFQGLSYFFGSEGLAPGLDGPFPGVLAAIFISPPPATNLRRIYGLYFKFEFLHSFLSFTSFNPRGTIQDFILR